MANVKVIRTGKMRRRQILIQRTKTLAFLFQGAQNIIHCATDNQNTDEKNPATGYMVRNVCQTKSKYQFDDLTSVRLWEESLKMCGL